MKMKKLRMVTAVITVLAVLCTTLSCSKKDAESAAVSNETRVVTDMLGRQVEIPAKINTIICTGSNALRMVSYLQATDKMVGVEDTDKKYETDVRRDYAYALHDTFKDMFSIGKGGGTAYTAYPEEILKVQPDVILTCFVQEAAEQLQKETGIPVVSIRTPSANFIDENWVKSLRFTAELTGTEKRCEELLSYIDSLKADLQNRVAGIADEDKPSCYTGAVTFSGAHGFAGTYANFGPFMGINAKNVADETGNKASFEVDLEKVAVWNPDIIFLDPGNMNLVNDEYASNPEYFHSLKAVREGRIYTMPSFNNYSTNITYCLMDAYFAGMVIYPEQFKDVDLKAKSNEILKMFLGREFYDEMAAGGLYYGNIELGK